MAPGNPNRYAALHAAYSAKATAVDALSFFAQGINAERPQRRPELFERFLLAARAKVPEAEATALGKLLILLFQPVFIAQTEWGP